jgi:hypothetical protein
MSDACALRDGTDESVQAPLSEREFEELGDVLRDAITDEPWDFSFRHTSAFLRARGLDEGRVIQYLEDHSLRCDWDVLRSVVSDS